MVRQSTDRMIHSNFRTHPTLEDRAMDKFGRAIIESIARRTVSHMTCHTCHLPFGGASGVAHDRAKLLEQMGLVKVNDYKSWNGSPSYELTPKGWERVEGGKPIWMD